jgi:hypothetical protein
MSDNSDYEGELDDEPIDEAGEREEESDEEPAPGDDEPIEE